MARRFRRFVTEHPTIPDIASRLAVLAVAGLLVYGIGMRLWWQIA